MRTYLPSFFAGLLLIACSPAPTVGTDAGVQTDAGQDGGLTCKDLCPSSTSLRCVGNSVESCDVRSNGCLDWSGPVACGSSQTCESGKCVTPACHSECTSMGSFQCAGNAVEQCLTGSDGCLHWSSPVACSANQTCQNGACLTSACHDLCAMAGTFQCVGANIEQCVTGASGCLEWSAAVACGANQVCMSGQCVNTPPACQNECATAGALQCVGDGVEQCAVSHLDGCLHWSTPVACAANQICQNGACQGMSSTCQNDCAMAGALQCVGNSVQQCASDSNGCLKWNTVSTCGTNQTCSNGQCVANCQDACPSQGAGQCVGSSIQVCELANTGCLAWSAPASCGPGSTCAGGACVSACSGQCPSSGATQCVGSGVQTCQAQPNGCLAWSTVQNCGANQTCSGGQCVTTMQMQQNTIGAACTQNTDCGVGNPPQCVPDTSGFPGGYCTAACTTSTDCGSTGSCVAGLFQDMNNMPISVCMENCASNADCRPAYYCGSNGTQNFCYPKCTSNAQCGTNGVCDLTTGACSISMATGSYPAPFPAPPQVITGGGPVLSATKIVPIFFANDDMTNVVPQLEDFYAKVGSSSYWQALSEYAVGPASSAPPVIISDQMPPTTVNDTAQAGSDVWQFLQSELAAGHLPTADANTVYVINYPAGTTITEGSSQSCTAFGGYHAEMDSASGAVAYIVLPRCQPPSNLSLQQMLTAYASHELAETATDPYPFTNPGWSSVDAAHLFLDTPFVATEIGDMCVQDPEAFYTPADLPYEVQRVWSNASASAGHDPCVPLLSGEVFFNAVPEMSDTINYTVYNQAVQVTGVNVPSGSSKTIPIDLYSDADTGGPWTVQVYDYNQLAGQTSNFTFTLDNSSGQNGTKLNLTITPTTGAGHQDVFYVVSALSNGTQHFTVGLASD